MVGLGGGGKQQGQQAGGGIGFARAGAAGDQGEPPPQGQGAGQFLPVAIGVFGGGVGLAGEQAIEPMADGGRINVGGGAGVGRGPAALQDVLGHRAFVMPIAAQIQFGRAGVGGEHHGLAAVGIAPHDPHQGAVLQSLQPGIQ